MVFTYRLQKMAFLNKHELRRQAAEHVGFSRPTLKSLTVQDSQITTFEVLPVVDLFISC